MGTEGKPNPSPPGEPPEDRAPALRMLDDDRASRGLGITLVAAEPGSAVVEMVVTDAMLNGFDIAHGGLVFTLADTAFAVACNEDERVTVAASAEISFLKATVAGTRLTATAARRVRRGRTGIYDITVTDDSGDVVAEFRGRSSTTDRLRPPGR